MLHYIYYICFILSFLRILNAIIVESENDIINELLKSSGIVTLSINTKIDIIKEIKINNSIQKLYIIGNSLNSAKLNLKYPFYFESSIEEIEIKNININGTLFFMKKNKIITLDTINLNGYIDSDFDNNSSNSIEITNLIYKPNGESVEYCINLSGNININKSYFYGDNSCQNRLLRYNGFNKYILNLRESYFNGNYKCPFLSIKDTLNANIETSYFEKGYGSKYVDGGYIKKII